MSRGQQGIGAVLASLAQPECTVSSLPASQLKSPPQYGFPWLPAKAVHKRKSAALAIFSLPWDNAVVDSLTKEKRSWNMRRITSKDTSPEIAFRKLIHRAGFRYRLHDKTLPGKPDLILKKYRSVVFIHGCFWHGHEGCKRGNMPKTNKKYWKNKIERNVARDKKNVTMLKRAGWRIFTVWECELKEPEKVLKRFRKFISKAGIAGRT